MGGLAFVISISFALLICCGILNSIGMGYEALSLLVTLIFCFFNSVIGVIDDLTKLKRQENAGLTPVQKLLLQAIFAAIFLFSRRVYLGDGTSLFIFGEMELGFFYYPIAMLLLLGIVNCANLSDGIDGLAASVAFTVGSVFFIGYGSYADLAVLSLTLVGGASAFLIYNIHPAKIFMGDTGSLFLGALAVGCAFAAGDPTVIIPIGIVYIVEGVSVILQVLIYKTKKKRLFKMAPIHHHLEKSGMSENKICVIAILLTLFVSVTVFTLLPR